MTRTSVPTVSIPTQLFIPQETTSPSSSGVSTPVAIGIGVGSAVAALLAAGTIGLLCFLRRRRRKRRKEEEPPSQPPPLPPKELAATPVSYRAVPPPYELSEDASPRRTSMPASKRHLSVASSSGKRSPLSGPGRESGALGYKPVELAAELPSESSLRDRASPESESSGWTDRQARGGTMPMPWI